MNARIKGIPEKFVVVFNEFVDTCNLVGLTFDDIKVDVGESSEGVEGLIIKMEVPNGLTVERANEIFNPFTQKYPTNYLTYNIAQESILEQVLKSKSQTVIEVTKGFKLERIS